MFGHTGYLINLAATNPEFHARSMRSLREELVRAEQLGLPFLVLHPGAHMGAGVEAGLAKVVSSLDRVFAELPENPVRIALEVTAGQGSTLGRTFEELAFILEHVRANRAPLRLPGHRAPLRRRPRHFHPGRRQEDLRRLRQDHRPRPARGAAFE